MNFSKRIGKVGIKEMQLESMDEELRNRLWNTFHHYYSYYKDTQDRRELLKSIWMFFLNKPYDPYSESFSEDVVYAIRRHFLKSDWNKVYDLIEYVASLRLSKSFIEKCNEALEKEMSGYRIIGTTVTPIISECEIKEIEEVLVGTEKIIPVSIHLNTALNNLTDRENPNYRNSIKESISAVESYCKIITGNDKIKFSDALVEIGKKHKLHGSLKKAFSALYGYTSDGGGIRHSLLEDDIKIEMEDAKFMLVTCSAFINYLKVKITIN